jgi:hypothetical protein
MATIFSAPQIGDPRATGIKNGGTADDKPDAPGDTSDTKLELPPPQKLRLFDKGWKSDDTKVFDVDRSKGKSTHTHTHTQCSLLGKVVGLML